MHRLIQIGPDGETHIFIFALIEDRRLIRRTIRVSPGAPWLKTTLVQAAWAAARTKNSYLRAQFLRLKSRRGPKKAILAVAASCPPPAYHMLRGDVAYRDLGPRYFDHRDQIKVVNRLLRRVADLGFHIEFRPAL